MAYSDACMKFGMQYHHAYKETDLESFPGLMDTAVDFGSTLRRYLGSIPPAGHIEQFSKCSLFPPGECMYDAKTTTMAITSLFTLLTRVLLMDVIAKRCDVLGP